MNGRTGVGRRVLGCAVALLVCAALCGAAPKGKPPGNSVSGKVTTSKGALAGVCLMGLPGHPVTGKNGEYAAAIPSGWSGSIVPGLWGYGFTPAAVSYTGLTGAHKQDFVATPQVCTITGSITKDGKGLAGVAIAGCPGNPVSDGKGAFTSRASPGWSAVITPSLAGHTFAPSACTFQDLRNDVTVAFSAYAKAAAPAKPSKPKRK